MRRVALVLALLAAACSGGGTPDGGPGGADAAAADGGAVDGGAMDGGPGDAGGADAAAMDGGVADGGASIPDGGGRVRGDCSEPGCDCVRLPGVEGGWQVCRGPRPEVGGCTGDPLDECCDASGCAGAGAGCFPASLFRCGGARPPEHNVCLADGCAADGDCAGDAALCVPAGVFGEPVGRCVPGGCRVDADCGAAAGGECNPFFDPCNRRLVGFFCAYAASECRGDLDCQDVQNGYCAAPLAPGEEPRCREFVPPP